MANSSLSTTLAEFTAQIQRTKNRLVAIPADLQRCLGIERRPDNHIVHVSIRPSGVGRWNHHYFKLTCDNEFAIPIDVTRFSAGDIVDVKVHRVIPDIALRLLPTSSTKLTGPGRLAELARADRSGWRRDGSDRVDEYLNADIGD